MSQLLIESRDGNLQEVMRLVRHGADLTAANVDGNTPLHFAASNGHAAMAEFLVNNGADVNAANAYGETALHLAAWGGQAVEVFQVSWKAN